MTKENYLWTPSGEGKCEKCGLTKTISGDNLKCKECYEETNTNIN